jgi:hypothetical protein
VAISTKRKGETQMARGRVITPDFWTDGNMIGMSAFARLFYIGLWNFAYCDKGHLPDDALGLKLKILPADPVDAAELLAEVMDAGRVVRVEADEKTYLWMPSFAPWQKTDPRWKTRCPACAHQDSLKLTETLVSYAESHLSSALREEKRTREERREEKKDLVQATPSRMLESEFAEWWKAYPRKQAKPDALKAFKAARKTTSLDTLTKGAQAYALLNLGGDRSKVKMPAGWLRSERWADEDQIAADEHTPPWVKQDAPIMHHTVTPAECTLHRGYPLPCDRCARDANDGREF